MLEKIYYNSAAIYGAAICRPPAIILPVSHSPLAVFAIFNPV